MSSQIARLFKKNNVKIEDILYATRNTQHTYIQMINGDCLETSAPVKSVAAELPEYDFWNIQKGVYVAKRHIVNIDSKYNYTMVDGKVFEGRHRTPGEHQRHRRKLLGEHVSHTPVNPQNKADNTTPELSLTERCAIMEDAPIAFCVIELVFHEGGIGIDFVFRYCNKEMAVLEGVPVEEMLNRSFYEVFPNGDKKWIIPYAEVALNGKQTIIRDFSPEINQMLTIHCFQPAKGYCACLLTIAETAPQQKENL